MKTIINKIHIIYAALLLTVATAGFAQAPQATGRISGSIVSADNKPVEFATVSLLRAKDSAVVKGALGDVNGQYKLDRVPNGNYIIKTTVVGFTKGLSKPFAITAANPEVKLPAITMGSSAKTLQTVNVQSSRPLIERKLDRTVMNVENSVLAAGNNAMEILERAPGVTVDKDDNISLQGKAGVTVMINDKLTYLSSAQLATMLRATDGSNIASIEVITNPSAKYDAAGNSGIINIKLKKNREVGTSGSITAGAGYGVAWKDNESISLNHKQGKLNAFGTFSHNDNKNGRDFNIIRVVDSVGKKSFFNQYTHMDQVNHNNNYRFGADYDLTKSHTIGFVVSGYTSNGEQRTPSTTYIGNTAGAVNSYLGSYSAINQYNENFAANLNDRLQLDTSGQSLSVDLDYSKFIGNSFANYANSSFLPNGSQQMTTTYLRNESPSKIDIRTGKVDYALPLTKTLKFETGAKFSSVKTDNNLLAERQNPAKVYVNDATRTNHFIYEEKIDAGYVNLGKTWKNTSAQIGLRTEYTSSVGTLTTAAPVVRHYFDLFPSLFINHTINKKNSVGFSYSRRIDRPNYGNLNPFIFYLDSLTYQQGNPFLKPQYTHSFELQYTWNNTINASLSYSRTSDIITELILTDPITKASFQTNMNLQTQNAYGLNVSSPFTIVKWWTGNINVNTFYLDNKSQGLLGGNLNSGGLSYIGKLGQNLTFIKGYRIELMSQYRSGIKTGIYDVRPQYATDAGISHSFANKKAMIKFSVSDIFNTRQNNVNSFYQSVDLQIRQRNETRVSRLTFTYNFGNNKIKARQHQTGADDEKNRAGGGN